MDFEELKDYIRKKLYEKGINIETQDYITKYIYLNQKLFNNILNPKQTVDNIINNLDFNIKTFNESKKTSALTKLARTTTLNGIWMPYKKQIEINPIRKIFSYFSEYVKKGQESTIMHEIDHCATTKYMYINEDEKNKFKKQIIDNARQKNISKFSQGFIVGAKLQDLYRLSRKYNNILSISGIRDMRYSITYSLDLRMFNEGITAYKQEMYDKFLGTKPHTSYIIEKQTAKLVGDVIGIKNLIQLHYNNDYEGMRKAFQEKTGQDLNDLVRYLNKSKLKQFIIPFYKNIYDKEIQHYKEPLDKKINYEDINVKLNNKNDKKQKFLDEIIVKYKEKNCNVLNENNMEMELQKGKERIRERGINGIGENVGKEISHGKVKSREDEEHSRGTGGGRGGR